MSVVPSCSDAVDSVSNPESVLCDFPDASQMQRTVLMLMERVGELELGLDARVEELDATVKKLDATVKELDAVKTRLEQTTATTLMAKRHLLRLSSIRPLHPYPYYDWPDEEV